MQPTTPTPTLEDAISLAAQAHKGQRDKAGQPYILHVLRVMLRQSDETARIAGVLHDVVEDTGITLAFLRADGYSGAVCEAIDCLTRRPGESYDAAITRVAGNETARQVKLADLEDNMSPDRMLPGAEAEQRREKYRQARNRLRSLTIQTS